MPTVLQSALGKVLVPPTPRPSGSFQELKQNLDNWTRTVSSTFRQFERTLVNLSVSQIPEKATGGAVVNGSATPVYGTGTYWSQSLFDAAFAAKNTDALAEGSTNEYFTSARFSSAFSAAFPSAFSSAFGAETTDALAEGSTNLYFSSALARAVISATSPLGYSPSTGVLSIQQASGSQPGYLSSADWSTFNGKQSALSAASASVSGYLTSTDWSTFNGKSPVLTFSGPLSLSGTTVSIPVASASSDGYLSAADWSTFHAATGGTTYSFSSPLVLTGTTVSLPAASASANGYLSSTDWSTFNGKQAALSAASASVSGYLTSTDWSTFNGKSPALTFSGPLSLSGTTVSIPVATSSVGGYLSSTDWSTFNGKQATLGFTPENVGNKSTDGTLGGATPSTTLYPSQSAVATFAGVKTRTVVLCLAYTPPSTGADTGEVPVPYKQDGSSVTYSVNRITLRLNAVGGTNTINVEKYTGTSGFSATVVGSVTVSGAANEGSVTAALGTVSSGDKLRFNVTSLGTATGWTIAVEISPP